MLAHDINVSYEEYRGLLLHSINGTRITSLSHLARFYASCEEPFLNLEFGGSGRKEKHAEQVVLELAPKVYALVIKYGGTTTGEHNDGIIRTPYLPMLFGPEMVALFAEVKQIFDPLNIFNPGKKVGGTFADIDKDMLTAD